MFASFKRTFHRKLSGRLAIIILITGLLTGLTGCKLKPKQNADSANADPEEQEPASGAAASEKKPTDDSASEPQQASDLDSLMVELRALRTEVGALREEVRGLKSLGGSASNRESDEEEQQVQVGLLSIDSRPGTASVLIDGVQVAGSTPLELHELSPGEHRVQVEFHESGRLSAIHKVVLPSGGLVELVLHDSPTPAEPALPQPALPQPASPDPVPVETPDAASRRAPNEASLGDSLFDQPSGGGSDAQGNGSETAPQ